MGSRVQVFRLIFDRAFNLLAIWCLGPWVRILHSAEEDKLVSFRFEYRLPLPASKLTKKHTVIWSSYLWIVYHILHLQSHCRTKPLSKPMLKYCKVIPIIDSDNGSSPTRRQCCWTSAGILLIWPLGTNFSEILIEICILSFKKMHLELSSGNWRLFC